MITKEIGLNRKPHKGDRIRFGSFVNGEPSADVRNPLHTVTRTPEGDDNICWILQDGHDRASCFIWRFKDGLNGLATIEETEAK